MNISQEQAKRMYYIDQEYAHLTRSERTKMCNEEFNTNFGNRALQQVSKNFGIAIEEQIKVDEILAKRELNIMVNQKKVTMMKRELHKKTNNLAISEIVKEKINEDLKLSSFQRVVSKPKVKGVLYEINISDIQFKGGEKEVKWVNHIFNKALDALKSYNITDKDEIRFSFNGDEVEGDSAHDSQLYEITKLMVGQVRELTPLLISGINSIMSEFKEVKKSVVYVPFSNHGLAFGKNRYQFMNEDMGLIIYDSLKLGLNEDIFLYDYNEHNYTVETDTDIYYHGHLAYNKSKKREDEVLGVDKNLKSGHKHHFNMLQERNRLRIGFSTCRRDYVGYEKSAGYKIEPEITLLKQVGKEISVIERIKL